MIFTQRCWDITWCRKIAEGPVPAVLPSPAVARIIRWTAHPSSVADEWSCCLRKGETWGGPYLQRAVYTHSVGLIPLHSTLFQAQLVTSSPVLNKNITQVLNISKPFLVLFINRCTTFTYNCQVTKDEYLFTVRKLSWLLYILNMQNSWVLVIDTASCIFQLNSSWQHFNPDTVQLFSYL